MQAEVQSIWMLGVSSWNVGVREMSCNSGLCCGQARRVMCKREHVCADVTMFWEL
jgi:hypothetical protein